MCRLRYDSSGKISDEPLVEGEVAEASHHEMVLVEEAFPYLEGVEELDAV
jgi:hypothetical protein